MSSWPPGRLVEATGNKRRLSVMYTDRLLRDESRSFTSPQSASPSLAKLLLELLDPVPGQRLLSATGVAGGYARSFADYDAVVYLLDRSSFQLREAVADAACSHAVAAVGSTLPFATASFHHAVMIGEPYSMISWDIALEELRRVVDGGRVVIQMETLENGYGNWATYYFPNPSPEFDAEFRPSEREIGGVMRTLGYSRVRCHHFKYTDFVDGNTAALKHWPVKFFDRSVRERMPFFRDMDATQLENGLESLEADYRSGTLWHLIERFRPAARRYGDVTLFVGET